MTDRLSEIEASECGNKGAVVDHSFIDVMTCQHGLDGDCKRCEAAEIMARATCSATDLVVENALLRRQRDALLDKMRSIAESLSDYAHARPGCHGDCCVCVAKSLAITAMDDCTPSSALDSGTGQTSEFAPEDLLTALRKCKAIISGAVLGYVCGNKPLADAEQKINEAVDEANAALAKYDPIPVPDDESLIAERLNLDANGVDQ